MIVNYVSRAMGARRLSIAEVARRSGLAYSTVHDLYHGKAKRVEFATLDKVCAAIGADSIADVLEYQPDQPRGAARSATRAAAPAPRAARSAVAPIGTADSHRRAAERLRALGKEDDARFQEQLAADISRIEQGGS